MLLVFKVLLMELAGSEIDFRWVCGRFSRLTLLPERQATKKPSVIKSIFYNTRRKKNCFCKNN
jgi:hypothetical protein